MVNKNQKSIFKIALIPAAVALFAGCADRDTIDPQTQGISQTSAALSTTAQQNTMTVAKGYATACSVVDANGLKAFEVDATNAPGLYNFLAAPSGIITASNCKNPVTETILPPLKTPAGKKVISPITDLLANGATEAQVRAFAGVDSSADLFADPIAVATSTSTALLKASARISSLIEAAIAANPTAGTNAAAGVVKSVKNGTTTDANLAIETGVPLATVTAINTTLSGLNTSGTDGAKQIEALLKVTRDAVKNNTVTTTLNAGQAANVAATDANITKAITTKTVAEIATTISAIAQKIVQTIVSGGTSDFVPPTLATQIKTDVQKVVDEITGNTGATGGTGSTGNTQ